MDPVKVQPALHKVSTESFRDLVTKQSANKDLVIVFAEENVSIFLHVQNIIRFKIAFDRKIKLELKDRSK